MKTDARERLQAISNSLRELDPDDYPALLFGFVGGMKGAARFDGEQLAPALHVLETVLNDFKTNGQKA